MSYFATCILCDSDKLIDLGRYKKDFLCKCKNCGFVFSKKYPTNKELSAYYKNYGTTSYLSEITIKRYHQLLNEFEKYRKTNRLLDVGCGRGLFLDEAKKRGWEVYGTELSEETTKICREKGINMFYGSLNETSFEPSSFDVITSLEVIEHINTPKNEIKSFKNLLRSEGLVYITTPNFNSLLRYKLKENYTNVIIYPEHLSYYTPKTLSFAFKKFGFKKIKIASTGLSFTQLKPGYKTSITENNIISSDSYDEKLRIKSENSSLMNLIKNVVNFFLTLSGTGDTLKGYFIKAD